MRRRRNFNCIRFHGFAVRIAPLMISIGPQEVYLKADFLIIGSGVAALRAAIELGGIGNTVLLTKASARAGNTGYAQGGIAAALDVEDSPLEHLADTVAAGDGLVDQDAARLLTEQAPIVVRQLIEWGGRFDRTDDGNLSFAREGAHSCRRVLHSRDSTGREIARVLWEKIRRIPNVKVVENALVVDAIIHHGECVGVQFWHGNKMVTVATASSTLLASGGAGYIYTETTNPEVSTGDGIAIAFRAGATIADMEFVQFHPTALDCGEGRRFLLSEALRGEGARLINEDGKEFIDDKAGSLSSRDRVARAIALERRRTGARVYLKFDRADSDFVHMRFPLISERCRLIGLDLAKDRIPVVPAAHYVMGGVWTDLIGQTSIPGLFAAGEVACTGVHGANRLASNSLLEGLVFGRAAAIGMKSRLHRAAAVSPLDLSIRSSVDTVDKDLVASENEMRDMLWDCCGLFRDSEKLRVAQTACREWLEAHVERRGPERLRSIVTVGELIARSALRREESRGAHYRSDFPHRNDIDWSRRTVLSKEEKTG